jgi:phospholipid/cholesterol/gamma-HCH transport system substrate-binding protein
LSTGLEDAGQNLRSIIVDGNALVTALQSAIPGTEQLINAGRNVLSTFNGTSNEFAAFSSNLNALTQQVAHSNADLIRLLQNGAAASSTLGTFLNSHGDSVVSFIDNFASATNVAYARQAAFKALFEVLPLFSTDVASVTTNGQIRFELAFNDRNTVCPYTSTMAAPTSLIAVADLTRNCSTQAPDLLQRGADKAPPPEG